MSRNAEVSDSVVTAFAAILGVDISKTRDIIAHSLGATRKNTNKGGYFSKQHALLPKIAITDISDTTMKIDGIPCTLLTSGASGTVWHGNNGSVYKVIETYRDDDSTFRGVFIEALIQVLLQNDTTYGANIAKLEKVYRASASSGFVYKMEHIAYTFKNFLESRDKPVSFTTIAPIFSSMGSILSYFEAKYGFHHRDLHIGNIMFAADGTPKLIDFGMSCLEIGGKVYSVDDSPCIAYDPLIFVANLYKFFMDYFDVPTQDRIRAYLTGKDGVNYYDKLEEWEDSFYMIDADGGRILKNRAIGPPHYSIPHYFYHTYSFNAEYPNDRRPWTLEYAPGQTWLQAFEAAGMPQRGTYAYFAKAWGPAGLPALAGGARRHRKSRRRAKVSRRPKATRRFKP